MRRLVLQPLVGFEMLAIASILLVACWEVQRPPGMSVDSGSSILLTLSIFAALVISHQFPIEIENRTKMYMGNVPLFLMAALLPPAEAAAVAALGTIAGELTVRSERGLYYSDVAAEAGRWTILVWIGATVAHLAASGVPRTEALLGAAITLWIGDLASAPFLINQINGRSPLEIARSYVCEAGLAEGALYLVGLLGALVALQQRWALALLLLPTILVYTAFKSVKDVDLGSRQILESMADTVDLRDAWTGGHSRRVAEYAAGIVSQLQVSPPEANLIVAAARIHDIGNIAIPDHIVRKPGRLTAEETILVQTHADRGAELLSRYPDFAAGAAVIRHHHERWDGAGYPAGLSGTEIPFGSRVIAVAESFDAMISDRPYRPAMTQQQAVYVLREGRGRQWDPAVVDALLRMVGDHMLDPGAPRLRVLSSRSDESGSTITA